MKKLLLGTTNSAKLEEYKTLLKDLPFELVTLGDLGISQKPPEGKTIEQSAILKAKFYYEKSGNIATLVDQGGLEIEALANQSGKDKIWIRPEMDDQGLMQELVKQMKDKDNRKCKLHIVVALATDIGVMTAESSLHGEIVHFVPDKKIEGLPYNSLLAFPSYGNKLYCDLSDNEKEILSQRKHAVEKIKDMFVEIAK